MNKPTLLVLSGMHGDEYKVINCVRLFLRHNKKTLPDFLFIPTVSPSAVSRHTRLNKYGHDVNRSFLNPPPDEEIALCFNQLSQHSFQLSLDFHEDSDKTDEFYLYDTGSFTQKQHNIYSQLLKKLNIKPYNGFDDPNDTTLNFTIRNGYISTPIDLTQKDTGFSSGYFIRHHISKRHITLEIPGKLDAVNKQKLVDSLFHFFLPFVS